MALNTKSNEKKEKKQTKNQIVTMAGLEGADEGQEEKAFLAF